jgi:hypothetical protein
MATCPVALAHLAQALRWSSGATESRDDEVAAWVRDLFALALTLFVVPATLEGPVLVPISQGHGLSLVDVVALVPLLAGTALLAGGLHCQADPEAPR